MTRERDRTESCSLCVSQGPYKGKVENTGRWVMVQRVKRED